MCAVRERWRFSRHKGVYSSDVSCEVAMRRGQRERCPFFPALPTSVSPTRLSLGRVASLQSPLLFHLVSSFRLSGSFSTAGSLQG